MGAQVARSDGMHGTMHLHLPGVGNAPEIRRSCPPCYGESTQCDDVVVEAFSPSCKRSAPRAPSSLTEYFLRCSRMKQTCRQSVLLSPCTSLLLLLLLGPFSFCALCLLSLKELVDLVLHQHPTKVAQITADVMPKAFFPNCQPSALAMTLDPLVPPWLRIGCHCLRRLLEKWSKLISTVIPAVVRRMVVSRRATIDINFETSLTSLAHFPTLTADNGIRCRLANVHTFTAHDDTRCPICLLVSVSGVVVCADG